MKLVTRGPAATPALDKLKLSELAPFSALTLMVRVLQCLWQGQTTSSSLIKRAPPDAGNAEISTIFDRIARQLVA